MINYNDYANEYDKRYLSDMCLWEDKAIYDAFCQIPNLFTKKIVDLGCGTGFLLDLLGDNIDANNYLGIDVSLEMIEISKNKYPNAKFVLDDSRKITEYMDSFKFKANLAVSLFTIPYIGVESIQAIYRALPKNGKFMAVYYDEPYINPSSVYSNRKLEYEMEVKPQVVKCIKCAQELFSTEYMRSLTSNNAYKIALFLKD